MLGAKEKEIFRLIIIKNKTRIHKKLNFFQKNIDKKEQWYYNNKQFIQKF